MRIEYSRDMDFNLYMDLALAEADRAAALGEVPIGAIVVDGSNVVIGRGYNRSISDHDPAAHAEIIALRQAAKQSRNYRLADATLYCTVEPCAMCAGAMIHARIARLVLGAPDPKAGAAGSLYNILQDPRLNHRIEVVRGIRDSECSARLRSFFEGKRSQFK